jgi:hypothetical protein
MARGMTHDHFINRPKPKTPKDYMHLPQYIEKSRSYYNKPKYLCDCGIWTVSIINHIQTIRHLNAMMKLHPIETITL